MNRAIPDLLPRTLDLVRITQSAPGGHCAFTVGDFCYRWQSEVDFSAPLPVQIWPGSAERDRGFAWLNGEHLHLVVHPGEETMLEEMLDWAETVASERYQLTNLRIPVVEGVIELQRLLTSRRYEPGEPTLIQRSRPLDLLPGFPSLAAGYQLTCVEKPSQIDGWTATYRAAFAEEMSGELRSLVSLHPLYRPELDIIACDANETVIAFALVWFDEKSGTGTFEPLGCHPNHRRLGLTRELMREGLARLREMGAGRAFVTTTRRRVPANNLYEGFGFQEEKTIRTWCRRKI